MAYLKTKKHLHILRTMSLIRFLLTAVTLHRIFPVITSNVLLQIAVLSETVIADIAFVPFHQVVNAAMLTQIAVALESFVAQITAVASFLCMRSDVNL